MPKAVAVIADNRYNYDTGLIDLVIAVIVRDVPTNIIAAGGIRMDTNVSINGTENPTQINNAIRDKVKTDAALFGITLADADISSTKFS